MENDYGYAYSMSGFVDFTNCFGEYDILWTITGFCICLGTIISYQPQDIAIISARSNYGINPFMTFVTNIGQGLVFFNILALHASDFIGLFQRKSDDSQHNFKIMATFLTFINMTLDWYTYKFVFLLNFIFIDKEPRIKRNQKEIKRETFLSRCLFGLSMFIEHFMLLLFFIIVVFYGFSSDLMRAYAKYSSVISSCAFSVQYLPQMITTCLLKDIGSYSIVSLSIILVGSTINFCFMTFGQKENWTTILPVGVTIVEQSILFSICLYFIIYRLRLRKKGIKESIYINQYTESRVSLSTQKTDYDHTNNIETDDNSDNAKRNTDFVTDPETLKKFRYQ